MRYLYQAMFVLASFLLLVFYGYAIRRTAISSFAGDILIFELAGQNYVLTWLLVELIVVAAGVAAGMAFRMGAGGGEKRLSFDWLSLAIYGILPLYLFVRYSTSGAIWLGLGPKTPLEAVLEAVLGRREAFSALTGLWPAFAFWFGLAIPLSWKSREEAAI